MTGGWFIGPFEPSVNQTSAFECAVKRYSAGDNEAPHVHKVATEYTVIVDGTVLVNGEKISSGTILEVAPGEATQFTALTDATTCVVKCPAVIGDKYLV